METIDHATGPEKLELLAKQQGNDVSITLIGFVSNLWHQRAIPNLTSVSRQSLIVNSE